MHQQFETMDTTQDTIFDASLEGVDLGFGLGAAKGQKEQTDLHITPLRLSSGEPSLTTVQTTMTSTKVMSSGAARDLYEFMVDDECGAASTDQNSVLSSTDTSVSFPPLSAMMPVVAQTTATTSEEVVTVTKEQSFNMLPEVGAAPEVFMGLGGMPLKDSSSIDGQQYQTHVIVTKVTRTIQRSAGDDRNGSAVDHDAGGVEDISFNWTEPATKEDLPDLTPAEYKAMNNRDPDNIEQARMPMEFYSDDKSYLPGKNRAVYPGSAVDHEVAGIENIGFDWIEPATKEDLPDLTPAEYEAMNNRDPANIEQARMPMEFFSDDKPKFTVNIKEVAPDEPETSTKEDLPDLTPAEYEAMNNRDPANIEQARMPFSFEPEAELNVVGPSVATKEDLPDLTPAEYEAMNNRDPANIEQARMPMEFYSDPEQDEHETATKEDLPDLTPAEYEAMNNRDPANIEQARMPMEFYSDPEQVTMPEGITFQITEFSDEPDISTKEDLPDLTPAEYEAMNNRDPANIEQARMPFSFEPEAELTVVEPSVATKEDLPDLTPAEYEAMNNRDPANIEQARMPMEFYSDPEQVTMPEGITFQITEVSDEPDISTKEDLPDLTPAEYEAMNNRDPTNIEQARMPFSFEPEAELNLVGPSVATKEDLPDLTPAEYEAMNNRDPANIEQARMPMEFYSDPEQVTMSEGITFQIREISDEPKTSTKEDLPDLTPAEYEAMNNRDPANIEQARMPFSFEPEAELNVVGPSVATKEDLPDLNQAEYEAMNSRDPANIEQARMPMEFYSDPEQVTMPDGISFQIREVSVGPSVASKEDLPDLTPAEYEAMNNRDPNNIEQARMPMEFYSDPEQVTMPEGISFQIREVSVGSSVATKEDLPDLTPAEYEAMNNRDPANIEQARMPMEFYSDPEQVTMPEGISFQIRDVFVGPSVATKEDLPDLTPAEYEAMNNRDPANIEQARMPMEFYAGPEQVTMLEDITFQIREVSDQPETSTKEDLPDLTPAEYEAMNNRDPANIEQARMPMEFYSDPEQVTMPEGITFKIREVAVGPSVATKEDLPDLTPAEYEAMNKRDPDNIEQARMPMDFQLESDETAGADPELDQIPVSSIRTTEEQEDDFDFDLPAPPQAALRKPRFTQQVEPSVATKEDLPDLTPAEYEAINNRDPANIEQARMPMEFYSDDKPPISLVKPNGFGPASPEVKSGDVKKEMAQEAAEDEWNNVQTITARFDDIGAVKPAKPDSLVTAEPFISFDEVFQFVQTANMDPYKSVIKTSINRSGLSAFCHVLFGPPKLHRDLHHERNLVFCAAACPFSDDEPTHFRVLKTIFRRLTGSKFDPPRHGNHWDQIGFQGTNPASDLRGTGFLGLMQLLYLVMDPKTYPLARDIYKLSQHETQNFPMAIMSINMTRLALQSLREDVLNKECNKRRQVMQVLNEYYAGAYLNMYTIWKQQHKTIADSGFVIKDVEHNSKKNPKHLIRTLDMNLEQRRHQVTGDLTEDGDQPLKFQDVCDFDEDD